MEGRGSRTGKGGTGGPTSSPRHQHQQPQERRWPPAGPLGRSGRALQPDGSSRGRERPGTAARGGAWRLSGYLRTPTGGASPWSQEGGRASWLEGEQSGQRRRETGTDWDPVPEWRSGRQEGARRLEQDQPGQGGNQNPRRLSKNQGQRGRGPGSSACLPQRIGPAFLEALLAKDPSVVAITLASSPGLAELLSQTTLRGPLLQLLCQVLRKACSSRMDRKSLQQVLGLVRESNFLRICLPQYVATMLTEVVPAVRHQCPEQVGHIVALVQELVSVFPASSIHQVSMVMSLLPGSMNALRASGVDFPEETEKSLEKLLGFIQHLQEKRRQGTLKVDTYTLVQPSPGGGEAAAAAGPAEDYRAMPIFPTYQEVHCDEGRGPLRPNLTHQPYESPTLYLDTHFRLLREDFVRPLREGIAQLLQCSADGGDLRRRKFDDIRVYFDTRILVPLCSANGIEHQVQFDPRPLRSVRWENSKRLLYGSLVCLSRDHFETLLFATVAQRDSQDLRKGTLQLAFIDPSRPLLAEVQPTDTFLMVETTAYFEAYRPVLLALQEMQEEDVPFQKYIVHCQTPVAEPAYLARGSSHLYNLSCLRRKPQAQEAAVEKEGAPEPLGSGPGRDGKVDVLDFQQWPAQEALGLDESQMQALQVALTKEVAIIQGPPGTGKTYVGLKVVQALLSNRAASCGDSPLLVVCYTNHALDQFLEGIYAFQRRGIVRVGGRSNSECLKKFTLREIRSTHDWLPRHLRQAYSNVLELMQDAQRDLERLGAELKCSLRGVLHERHLQRHMAQAHWESLTQQEEQAEAWWTPRGSLLLEWLGLGAVSLSSQGAPNKEEEEAQPAEPPEEELLQVVEEADLLQDERLLDEDEVGLRDPHRWRRRRREEEEEEGEAHLDNQFLAMTLKEKKEEDPGDPEKEEQWEYQRHQKKAMKHHLKVELAKRDRMAEEEAEAVQDVWRLNGASRWQLYRLWVQKYQAEIRRRMLPHEEAYREAAGRMSEVRLHKDLLILQEAQVVGMTTTGAARYRQVLQQVGPRVVVVEEAAEVLEAHTLTTLSSACQHLILIGDHQQLRPSANVYDLARNFNLEVSLFERLVKVGFPFVRLNFQHRMRPEIARLLTPSIYRHLENHPSVLQYENIKGISSNLFFVDHTCPEQEITEGRSHQNPHEAHFVVELCRYLLCQGYLPSQITILTTYTGQLYCLRKLLPATLFQGVKVHVVDKYQGEENDIILLSLVRSNAQGRVGFLQIPNRVCVALSRARKGLYCIGNAGMLGQVPLWSQILHALREKGQVGPSLLLACQNHPETKTPVAQPADFQKVPEGGCSRPCQTRLNCGHVCPRACHPYDLEHKEVQCLKPCQKVLCPDGHRCLLSCFQPCGKCQVKVPKMLPSCGHLQEVPCSMPAQDFCCQEPCQKTLSCGHSCRRTCGQFCTKRCPEKVQATLPCGHSQEVECAMTADIQDGRPVPCHGKCLSSLECGHPCSGSCRACFGGRFHTPCQSPCTRLLICSHMCREHCTGNCPPCSLPCQNSCIHSSCPKACGEACTPCAEPCPWRCQHYQCSRLCSEPCDRPRCDWPCPETLPCGHPCAGMCGDPCPPKCLVCHREELTQIFFGFEDEPGARFVQLEDCGHLFESQGLDCYMEGDGGKEEEEGGGVETAVRLKICPRCQTPIRKNLRYGTLVKRSLSEVEAVKERIRGCPAEIATQVQRLLGELKGKACLRNLWPAQYKQLCRELRREQPPPSIGYLALVEHLIGFYGRLAQLRAGLKEVPATESARTRDRLDEVAGWLARPRLSLTSQELSDLQCELRRLTYLVDLLARCGAATGKREASTAEQINTIQRLLERPGRFTPEDEAVVEATMEALKALLPASGLGLSEEERKQIVAAVTGNTRGHWFKCPNGHIYVIGDCGGAMERSRCPECQEAIGGENHRLEASNRLAPEMDGATHAAWSEGANALNMARLQWLH